MIKEFDLEIFGKKLWVGINSSYDEAKSLLGIRVKKGLYDDWSISNYNEMEEGNSEGTTVRVCAEKEPHRQGYFVNIPGNFDDNNPILDVEDYTKEENIPNLINTIAHESAHVCDLMKEDIGMRDSDTETNAYIIGFCTQKIYETILEYKKAYEKDPMDGATGDPKGALGEKGGEDATTNGEEDGATPNS